MTPQTHSQTIQPQGQTMQPPPPGIDWHSTAIMIVIALWGGVVSYLRHLSKGAKFRLLWCISHISSSAMAGLLTVWVCQEYGVSLPLTGVCCAIAGHMGAEAIKIVEEKIVRPIFEGPRA